MGTITITQYIIYTNQVSNIPHEAAISCKPLTDTQFYRKQKILDLSLTDQQLGMLCFKENIWLSNFCVHNILTEGVCNPAV